MTARVRSAFLAAALASAVALTGCTAAGWEPEAPPAAGSQAELSTLDKARNVLFVVDDAGSGFLLGTLASIKGTEVQGIAYSPELPDGTFGEPATVDYTGQIPAKGALRLDDESVAVSNPELSAGRLAKVTFQLSTGTLELEAPIYASDHPDYAKYFG